MAWDSQGVLERCAMSAATAWGFYLMARFVNHRWHMVALEQQLQESQAALEHEREKRKADRVGRIRAEQELRTTKVQLQQMQLQQQNVAAVAGEGGAAAMPGAAARAAGMQVEEEADVNSDGGKQAEAESSGGGEGGAVPARAQVLDDRKRAAAAAALAAAGAAMPVFPFRPIGHLQSVFTERNGTPRQPQLVPAARSRLVLAPNVPAACLEGLQQYSHCWVLYVFHANTDLAKYLSPDRSGLKAKISVPRLNGGRMGVLATRSPHRPSPIGLSTAEIIGVEGNTLILGGADIVDGSPVLDIKPYVPFCDCLAGAKAPEWVQAEAADEPLAVGAVAVGPAAREALLRAWGSRKSRSMYRSSEQFLELVRQVLGRDIRSVNQRINVKPIAPAKVAAAGTEASRRPASVLAVGSSSPSTLRAPVAPHTGATFALQPPPPPAAPPSSAGKGPDGSGAPGPGHYHVVLENIYISYDICAQTGGVEVHDAWVDPITARG